MWTSTKSRFDFELSRELRKNGRMAPNGPRELSRTEARRRSTGFGRRNSLLQDGRSGAQGLTDDSTIGDAANNGRASRGESNIGIRRTPSNTQERNIPALR